MRATKFRQAAMVYLHVAILYEAAAYVMWRRNLLPATRLGPAWLWLILGAAMGVGIAIALYRWHNPWLARIVWGIHALRLPTLIAGAFFTPAPHVAPPAFYIVAIFIVLINLWMLARAGWDL